MGDGKAGQTHSRVLSGIQPSGVLHIGNYFGSIKQFIQLQDEYPGNAFYFIADYHAMTTVQDPETLTSLIRGVIIDYLALGLDPEKATLYRQSDIPQVCELTWILACVTGKGLLDRAVSYKDKVQQGVSASVGLWLYPELMAADILIVKSTVVPVGQDQSQHLEMTRDIATSFNSAYNADTFPSPDTLLNEARVVPGIDGQKMSKSYTNTIAIFADEAEIKARTKRVKTNSTPMGDPLDPDNDVVFDLYKLVGSPDEIAEMREAYLSGSVGYGHAKSALVEAINAYFAPFRARHAELVSDTAYVDDILREGARRASDIADETMDAVRDLTGLGQRALAGSR